MPIKIKMRMARPFAFLLHNRIMKLLADIYSELRLVFTGKTIDALVPPLVFVIASGLVEDVQAIALALLVSSVFFLLRLRQRQSIWYSVTGFVGTLFAGSLAILGDAADFFIPGMISSFTLLAASLISILLGKPFTAYVSHITRGWTLSWFWRADVKPAYMETTWIWAVFFLVRLLLQFNAFLGAELTDIALINLLLGFPGLTALLIVTYAWGLPRLRRLKGPGIDEYNHNTEPPWRGQTKGF
jgi:hypothetical protein